MLHPETPSPALPAPDPSHLTLDPAQLNHTPAYLNMDPAQPNKTQPTSPWIQHCQNQSPQFQPTSHQIQLGQTHVATFGGC
ncbi:hypothetical protein FKM82_006093 [Ascaphus truei]